MMDYTQLPGLYRAIAPYQPGKPISELERELGITGMSSWRRTRTAGCSPLAMTAMQEALKTIALYPMATASS